MSGIRIAEQLFCRVVDPRQKEVIYERAEKTRGAYILLDWIAAATLGTEESGRYGEVGL